MTASGGGGLAGLGEGVVAAAGLGGERTVNRLGREEQREAVTQPAAQRVATASQAEEPRHRRNRDRWPEGLRARCWGVASEYVGVCHHLLRRRHEGTRERPLKSRAWQAA